MATVRIAIKKDEPKSDGTWRVKFRLSHKSKPDYINTNVYVDKSQLTRGTLKIKDEDIFTALDPQLKFYRNKIAKMNDLAYITVQELKARLQAADEEADKELPSRDVKINFIDFIDKVMEKRKANNQTGDLDNMRMVKNSLIDYYGHKNIPITNITSKMLFKYEDYLKQPRKMLRPQNGGTIQEIQSEGLKKSGLHKHMSMVRLLFNEAKKEYNDPDLGKMVIFHYPFERYRIGKYPQTKNRVTDIDTVKAIRDSNVTPGSRAEVGRDLFMLSFYLCGMNAVDMLYLDEYKGEGRVDYNRSKTKGKRTDEAFISIKVPNNEARELLYKYAGIIGKRYSNRKTITRAINWGLDDLGFPEITMYWARHTFSTHASKNGMSLEDIGMALNHREQQYRVTGIYVEPDWSIIDRVQEAVLSLLDNDQNTKSSMKVVL